MPLDLSRIRALCFDVDGTLSDTDDQWARVFESLLLPFRFLFPKRNVKPFARFIVMGIETPGNMAYTLLDRLGLDDNVAHLYNVLARRHRFKVKPFLLVPTIKEALVLLHDHYPMSIVSARDCHSTDSFLNQFELTPLFKAVCTSQTCAYTKPYPDPVRWAASQMGVQPEECLMIGDTTVDIRAGKAAGAQTVGVLCGFGTEGELLRAGADLILPSTADLAQILLLDRGSTQKDGFASGLSGSLPFPVVNIGSAGPTEVSEGIR